MLGSRQQSSEGSLASRGTARRPNVGSAVIVCGRNEDTRLLLRGLLRLHRYRVVHEATTPDDLDGLPSVPGPVVMVVDAESEVAPWDAQLAATLGGHPELRAVVILPREATRSAERAKAAGASAVVGRPFAIHDLIDAVDRTAAEARPPARQP